MLGCPILYILYLEGMRKMMFQLSGFYIIVYIRLLRVIHVQGHSPLLERDLGYVRWVVFWCFRLPESTGCVGCSVRCLGVVGVMLHFVRFKAMTLIPFLGVSGQKMIKATLLI